MIIKVLVVEDKPPILWSIKQKIENFSKELIIVGEAYNGKDALSMINEYKPDIVFTDIKMPIMDGLELISNAKKNHPHTHFAIISGYDEFEYARQAMKLGVSDYILKPITQETISELLTKIVGEIKERVSTSEKRLLQEQLNYGSLINLEKHQFGYQDYIIALACAGSYSSHDTGFTNWCNYFWAKVNYNDIISGHLPEDVFFWGFDGKNLNEMIMLLGLPGGCSFNIQEAFRSIGRELSLIGAPVTIAVSKKCNDVNKINVEAQNTRLLLRKNLGFGKSSLIFSDHAGVHANEKSPVLNASLEKVLASYVQGGHRAQFFNELKKIMEHWEKNDFKQYNIENSLKYIARICKKAVLDSSEVLDNLDMEIEEMLCISKDYRSLAQGLDSLFGHFFPNTGDSKQKREPLKAIIDDVVDYIHANFAKQITINDIADMVNVDPCHLSKTFKNIKGTSPMDYLTNLRIEKSKELIHNDSNLMLKDIAEVVGYTNQYYFSRVFKMVTGLSPSEYKNLK